MIKAIEEDFIVEERAEILFEDKGAYKVYILEKRGWNTLDLINHIAKILKIPVSSISYGSKKDKHGRTFQFITIRQRKDASLEDENFSLKLIGSASRPISSDLIKSNFFRITIRNILNKKLIYKTLEKIKNFEVPNYFDAHRFRSYDKSWVFCSENIEKTLEWSYSGFFNIYFHDMKGKEKRRSEEIFKNWRDWEKCYHISKTRLERKILSLLKESEKNTVKALHLIPKEELKETISS